MQPTTQLVVKHQVILGVIRKHGQIIQTVVVPRKRNVPLVKGTVTHIVNATAALFVRLTAAPNPKDFMNVHLAANNLPLNYYQVLHKTLKWPIKIIILAIIDPVKHNLNYHCFLGYDFKTLNNTECITFGNKLETWKEAEQACISDKKCEGVMNYGCNHQNFAMCLKDEEILTSSKNKSCIHMKFSISKLQITKLTSYQTTLEYNIFQ